MAVVSPRPVLAPLQRVMLRDTLAAPEAGHHVEQVEIRFTAAVSGGQVIRAWKDTVRGTEALQVAFLPDLSGVKSATARKLSLHGSFRDGWLAEDRRRPVLDLTGVPWRACFWPTQGRFVWTFHHALLDGRSIARVLRGFLDRLCGRPGETLALSRWSPPDEEEIGRACEIWGSEWPRTREAAEDDASGSAVRCMGAPMGGGDPASFIHAWGRALMAVAGTDEVWVEQVRAGAPQPGTAGFTMNTLPVRLTRLESRGDLRARLRALRAVERVSEEDFPYGKFPECGSVIMIEHATLAHFTACAAVESVVLHEARGETLMATAHLLPDQRLEVEGPGRHGLLEGWVRALQPDPCEIGGR